MSEKQKVVYLPDFRVKKKRELRWWRGRHPLQLLKIPVAFLIIFTAGSAVYFMGNDLLLSAVHMWIIAFAGMFLFWFLEYQISKDNYLVKKPD